MSASTLRASSGGRAATAPRLGRPQRTTALRVVAFVDNGSKKSTAGGKPWTVDSWRALPIVQQPTYPDKAEYKRVLDEIAQYPPLVFGELLNVPTPTSLLAPRAHPASVARHAARMFAPAAACRGLGT